jgi:mono/diheme cytochrome c family protein
MGTKKIIIPFLASALLLNACHNKSVPVITSRTEFPPAPKSSVPPLPENSPEAIAAGKILFETRCNRCHDLKVVDAYTPERWTTILQTMIPRARLNEEQGKQVRSYVMANAKK